MASLLTEYLSISKYCSGTEPDLSSATNAWKKEHSKGLSLHLVKHLWKLGSQYIVAAKFVQKYAKSLYLLVIHTDQRTSHDQGITG